jgi:hypothetical protein
VFQQTADDHDGDNSEESTSLGMTDTLEEPAKVEMLQHEDGNEEVSQSKELCRADCSRDRLLVRFVRALSQPRSYPPL